LGWLRWPGFGRHWATGATEAACVSGHVAMEGAPGAVIATAAPFLARFFAPPDPA
jgi:hypothetical protein